VTRTLIDYCGQHENWLIDTIDALVAIESPTDDKAAVDRCGAELARRLAEIGGRTEFYPQHAAGNHLRADFGRGDRQVLLLGHFDTVWPVGQLQRMPFVRTSDQLRGPGVLDMKAGIALGMLAVRAVTATQPLDRTRTVMLWTTDEETGSETSRAILEEEARRSDAVLVLEPSLPGGVLKTSRKGCGQYEIVIRGEPAHAGVDPGKGVSAIREMARQILDVETLQDLTRGISVNVGVVHGGTRANVVAPEARAIVDVRAPSLADAQRVDAAIRALRPHLAGAAIEVNGGFERPPMERTAGVARLYALAQDVAATIGQTLDEGSTGGGSDGNFCAALGVPTLDGLGAIGDGAHALHEHVSVPSLVPRATLLAALLLRLTQSSQ
jgi:glutamate carboxypeptidase